MSRISRPPLVRRLRSCWKTFIVCRRSCGAYFGAYPLVVSKFGESAAASRVLVRAAGARTAGVPGLGLARLRLAGLALGPRLARPRLAGVGLTGLNLVRR